MDIVTALKPDPPVVVEYVRLPDEIVTGRFNASGKEDPDGNLFITVKDTSFIWGVFKDNLLAGQRGDMVFTNVPGTFLVGGTFTQWDPAADEPVIGQALFTLISTERGEGTIRISGRNTSESDLPAVLERAEAERILDGALDDVAGDVFRPVRLLAQVTMNQSDVEL